MPVNGLGMLWVLNLNDRDSCTHCRCRNDGSVSCTDNSACSALGGCLYSLPFYTGTVRVTSIHRHRGHLRITRGCHDRLCLQLKPEVDALPAGRIDVSSALTQLQSIESASTFTLSGLKSQLDADVAATSGLNFASIQSSIQTVLTGAYFLWYR